MFNDVENLVCLMPKDVRADKRFNVGDSAFSAIKHTVYTVSTDEPGLSRHPASLAARQQQDGGGDQANQVWLRLTIRFLSVLVLAIHEL